MLLKSKLPYIFILIFVVIQSAFAEWVGITSSKESENPCSFKIISINSKKIEIEFSLSGYKLENIYLDGKNFQRIKLDRTGDLGQIGLPDLPAFSRTIALPEKAGFHLEVKEIETVEKSGVLIAPQQPPHIDNRETDYQFVYDQDFYQKDAFYPQSYLQIGHPVIMRELRLLPIDFYPFTYNPATQTLRIVKRMRIVINFEGSGENPKFKHFDSVSTSFQPLFQSMVLNYDQLALEDEPTPKGGYLVICNPQAYNQLQPLVEWKRQKGHYVEWGNLNSIGNSFANIYAYIYNAYYTWEDPPEFVLLVGDVDGPFALATEYYTGDVTDHKYSTLEGLDYFPDVLVGRISVQNQSQLQVVINKIFNYERQPDTTNTLWMKKGLLIACTDEISCKHTKQWIKQTMLENNYAGVDTFWYSFLLQVDQVANSINRGVSWVNYRGWNDWGGWGNDDIYALTNGFKLPMVTGMVCNTGDFGESECLAEGWLRAGSVNNPCGGIAATGPASLYTHTKWNNCLDMGFYAGVFDYGVTTTTGALNAAKMELWLEYPNNRGPGTTSNSVECYFHEYNMIGDPGLELWTFEPTFMQAAVDSQIPLGTNNLPLTVTNLNTGEPISEVYACLYQNGDILDRGYTDDEGYIDLFPDSSDTGNMILTLTKHNHYPVQDTISVIQPSIFLGYIDSFFNDDSLGMSAGNGDGIINPGETIEFQVRLCNFGLDTAYNVNAQLSVEDDAISLQNNITTFNTISPGEMIFGNENFVFSVSPYCDNGHIIEFNLSAFSDVGDTSNSIIEIPVEGITLTVDSVFIDPASSTIQPGDTANIIVRFQNEGVVNSGEIEMTLENDNPWFEILEPNSVLAPSEPGDTLSNFLQPFTIVTSADFIQGCRPNFYLALVNYSGYSQSLNFLLKIGANGVSDPVGPDEYGYYAFGIEDTSYSQCPQYRWISASGGTVIPLNEGGEQEASQTIDLPFNFRFYGQDFTQLTVSSSGWTSLIPTTLHCFYNYDIPSTLGPNAMIAPFWDDLTIGSATIRYQYFSSSGILVVEWYNTQVYQAGGTNTFEMILYDPALYSTPTGDGKIQFQYETFNNTDASNNYCTVGIEAPGGFDGLKYTYANIYPLNAGILSNRKAVLFTTLYADSDSAPVIFSILPSTLDSVEIGQSVTFKADAFDFEGEDLDYLWYHRETLVGQGNICTINFEETGSDSVIVFVSDGVNQSEALWQFEVYSLGFVGNLSSLPLRFNLGPLHPNPFNPVLTINFALAQTEKVKISIYNILGQKAAHILDETLPSGYYQTKWNADVQASGIYLVRMETNDFTATKKVLLLK